MGIRIEPYGEQHVAAALAFNDRLRERGKDDLLLNSSAPVLEPPDAPIVNNHFLAVEEDAVRGGFLMARFPGYFGQSGNAPVYNCREPVSEGIIDSKYSMLALRMLKHIQQQSPYVFALGMGGEQRPYARLLRGAGWSISPVPFLFRVVRASRFLQEIRVLQTSPLRKAAALMGAWTGTGALGTAVLQHRSIGSRPARDWTIERVIEWGPWADAIWEQFRPLCAFAVSRDRATLAALYPLDDDRTSAFLIRHNGEAVSWAVTSNRRMRENKYFGNMQVGSVLDCVGPEEAMKPTAALAAQTLIDDGADLIVTNQSHERWIETFRNIGFLSFRSNYILALSKDFAAAIGKMDGNTGRMHFTRGDGDGRIFL